MVFRDLKRMKFAVARRARTALRKLRARAWGRQRPVILMYHRIADEPFDPWGIAVAPDKFADQLCWIRKHRTPLPLAEFARLHGLGALPDDAVAVTFDDGYACTAEVAAPLLDRFGVPATVFLPAGLIGRDQPFWWDELKHIVMSHSGAELRALGKSWPIGEKQEKDAAWPSRLEQRTPRQTGFYALWSRLQPLPGTAIEVAMAELRSQQPVAAMSESERLMTVDEVRSMRSKAIDFGAHAMSHASLPGLPAAEKAREIRDSIDACEKLVDARPVTFAYPFGDFDAECEALVAETGFVCACTVEPRAVDATDGVFALPRLNVGNWAGRQLRQKLAEAALEAKSAAVGA